VDAAIRIDLTLCRGYALYPHYGAGIDLEEVSGETHHILPVPSTFIIGTDGTIHFQYTNTDYKVRLAPDVLTAAARSMAEGMDGRLVEQREAQRE
jgi:peroxiredoxin